MSRAVSATTYLSYNSCKTLVRQGNQSQKQSFSLSYQKSKNHWKNYIRFFRYLGKYPKKYHRISGNPREKNEKTITQTCVFFGAAGGKNPYTARHKKNTSENLTFVCFYWQDTVRDSYVFKITFVFFLAWIPSDRVRNRFSCRNMLLGICYFEQTWIANMSLCRRPPCLPIAAPVFLIPFNTPARCPQFRFLYFPLAPTPLPVRPWQNHTHV